MGLNIFLFEVFSILMWSNLTKETEPGKIERFYKNISWLPEHLFPFQIVGYVFQTYSELASFFFFKAKLQR